MLADSLARQQNPASCLRIDVAQVSAICVLKPSWESRLDFLAQSPLVLSTEFRLEVRFGLGAQFPTLVTREIPSTLEARLREDLAREGYLEDLVHLQVEFEDVEANALNVRVIGDFAGTAAPRYWVLRRAIQRSCVEACTDYGWAMLFPQLMDLITSAATQPPRPGADGTRRVWPCAPGYGDNRWCYGSPSRRRHSAGCRAARDIHGIPTPPVVVAHCRGTRRSPLRSRGQTLVKD